MKTHPTMCALLLLLTMAVPAAFTLGMHGANSTAYDDGYHAGLARAEWIFNGRMPIDGESE